MLLLRRHQRERCAASGIQRQGSAVTLECFEDQSVTFRAVALFCWCVCVDLLGWIFLDLLFFSSDCSNVIISSSCSISAIMPATGIIRDELLQVLDTR